MKPQWNSIRNFHCMWFEDSHVLNDYFGFQREDVKDYWQEILSTHPYYKLGKILPAKLVSKLAIERLLKDENAPRYWVNTKQDGKVKAFSAAEKTLRACRAIGVSIRFCATDSLQTAISTMTICVTKQSSKSTAIFSITAMTKQSPTNSSI